MRFLRLTSKFIEIHWEIRLPNRLINVIEILSYFSVMTKQKIRRSNPFSLNKIQTVYTKKCGYNCNALLLPTKEICYKYLKIH